MQIVGDIMGKNNEKITKTEQKKGRINKGAAAQLVAGICREKLWATPEETAAWLKTETGQRITTLIEKKREERRKQ